MGIGRGCGVLFDGHAKFVEGAIIFDVLGSDALGDGLGALELNAGIEEATLFAGMQLELALGACSVGIEAGGENRAAVGAAAAGDGADHAGGAGTELIGAAGTAGRRLAIVMNFFFFVLFFRVAITAVAVLTIHSTPPSARFDGLLLT